MTAISNATAIQILQEHAQRRRAARLQELREASDLMGATLREFFLAIPMEHPTPAYHRLWRDVYLGLVLHWIKLEPHLAYRYARALAHHSRWLEATEGIGRLMGDTWL